MPKLKTDDTEFELSVEKYKAREESEWCEIKLVVKNSYMNYCDCGEILQGSEVNEIVEELNDLIYDRIPKETELTFIEPDISMLLQPAQMYFSQQGKIWCRAGHGASDCYLDITIHFRDSRGVYIGEEWTITLNRDEIMLLLDGLEMEIGKRKKPRETIGLVGVSFIGNYEDIYWYRYDGNDLWNRRFVKVEHKGENQFGLVEYVRHYDINHLPSKLTELKNIIEILPKGEKERALAKEWEDRGNEGIGEHTLKMNFDDGTEFSIEQKGAEYRVVVHNDIIHYNKKHLFCYGDERGIADTFGLFVAGRLHEVTAIGTQDPHLTFVLYPKGAEIVRDEGEDFYPKDLQGNPLMKYYESNTMKIELDLCLNGSYGEQFWIMQLTEEETENFVTQWTVKISE